MYMGYVIQKIQIFKQICSVHINLDYGNDINIITSSFFFCKGFYDGLGVPKCSWKHAKNLHPSGVGAVL